MIEQHIIGTLCGYSCSHNVDHDAAEAFQTFLEEFDPSLSINPTLPSINPSISQAVFSNGPVIVNVRLH